MKKWPNFENEEKAYLIVFYTEDDPDQSEWVEQILQLDDKTMNNSRFIIISVDIDTPELAGLEDTIGSVCRVKKSESEHYMKQCPYSTTPFALTLNKNKQVHQFNIRSAQLRKALHAALLQ